MRRRFNICPAAPQPKRGEPIVPMINVVFLLLIFFLMTAQIAPPDPFDIDLPAAPLGDSAEAALPLYLSADGEIAFGAARGAPALQAAKDQGPVVLRADAHAKGADLARALTQLAALGAGEVTLVTQERAP